LPSVAFSIRIFPGLGRPGFSPFAAHSHVGCAACHWYPAAMERAYKQFICGAMDRVAYPCRMASVSRRRHLDQRHIPFYRQPGRRRARPPFLPPRTSPVAQPSRLRVRAPSRCSGPTHRRPTKAPNQRRTRSRRQNSLQTCRKPITSRAPPERCPFFRTPPLPRSSNANSSNMSNFHD
jgi:hypothetical protein